MNDPRTLTLFTVVFILLGIFNVFSGLRRMREARARGQRIAWYRQINILTGLEFILLSLIFLMSLNSKGLPNSVRGVVGTFYMLRLFLIRVPLEKANRLKQPEMLPSAQQIRQQRKI